MKMAESKISQRGSVVIPKAIREALQVADGDSVEWHVNAPREGQVVISIIKKGEPLR